MTVEASTPGVQTTRAADASLVRANGGDAIAVRVTLARSFWGRFRGLMGRAPLESDEGLYLPVGSIHMLFMRFPIDALFLDARDTDGVQRVIAIRAGLRPWTGLVMPVRGAAGVVELPDGSVARAGLAVGDPVRLEEHARS